MCIQSAHRIPCGSPGLQPLWYRARTTKVHPLIEPSIGESRRLGTVLFAQWF
jgi:hypothetical protein